MDVQLQRLMYGYLDDHVLPVFPGRFPDFIEPPWHHDGKHQRPHGHQAVPAAQQFVDRLADHHHRAGRAVEAVASPAVIMARALVGMVRDTGVDENRGRQPDHQRRKRQHEGQETDFLAGQQLAQQQGGNPRRNGGDAADIE